MDATHCDCIIPAGGSARRMGAPKQILPLGGSSLLATAISRAATHCARCIVVTGAARDRVGSVIPRIDTVLEVHNADHDAGMITSIMAGARLVETAWFFIAPGDMPLLPAAAFSLLAEAAVPITAPSSAGAESATAEHPAARGTTPGDAASYPMAFFPVSGGRRGHPVLVSARVIPDLLSHGHEYASMGAFLRQFPVREVEVTDEGIFVDVDTPADLAAIQSRSKNDSAT